MPPSVPMVFRMAVLVAALSGIRPRYLCLKWKVYDVKLKWNATDDNDNRGPRLSDRGYVIAPGFSWQTRFPVVALHRPFRNVLLRKCTIQSYEKDPGPSQIFWKLSAIISVFELKSFSCWSLSNFGSAKPDDQLHARHRQTTTKWRFGMKLVENIRALAWKALKLKHCHAWAHIPSKIFQFRPFLPFDGRSMNGEIKFSWCSKHKYRLFWHWRIVLRLLCIYFSQLEKLLMLLSFWFQLRNFIWLSNYFQLSNTNKTRKIATKHRSLPNWYCQWSWAAINVI